MKKIQAPEVVAISMQFGELKLYSIIRIDLKILSNKLKERAQISQ